MHLRDRSLAIALCALATPFIAAVSAQNVITTFAGTDFVFSGDGKPAVQAQLGRVSNVAADLSGNVYTGDVENHLVYRIGPDGTLTVIAGNGIAGYTGDGGQATQASVVAPIYLALGPQGDLFIGDPVNVAIRKVDRNGIISTVGSFSNLFGMVVGQDGAIYYSDFSNVHKIQGGTNQVFAGATILLKPQGLALDQAGNLYIADGTNGLVRMVTQSGTMTTIAGGGKLTQDGEPALQTAFRTLTGIAVDGLGNIYVADASSAVVRRIAPDQTVHTVAGIFSAGFTGDGGAGISASIGTTLGLAVDNLGALYIADGDNLRVRKLGANGILKTIAGVGQTRFSGDGGAAVNATFGSLGGIALDSKGNLFISDSSNHRVRVVGKDGVIHTAAGTGVAGDTGDEGRGLSATLLSPAGLATTPGGDLFIADRNGGSRRIRRLGADGIMHAAAGKPGAGNPASFSFPIDARQVQIGDPASITTDVAGNLYYLDSSYVRSIFMVPPSEMLGGVTCTVTPQCPPVNYVGELVTSDYSLTVATQVAIGKDLLAYVAVPAAGVYRVESNGTMTILAGNGQFIPPYDSADGITFDNSGKVVFTNNFYVYRIDPTQITRLAGAGGFLAPVIDGGSPTASGMFPTSPVFDAQGNLYVADQASQRVRVILANAPAIAAAPQSLSFSGTSQGPLPLPQQIKVTGAIPSLGFQVTTSTTDGGTWLQAALKSGLTPRLVDINTDPSNLQPGDYTGTVTISAPLATPHSMTIAVSFHVDPGLPAQPVLDQQNLSFTYANTGNASSRTLVLSNTGGGAINFQVTTVTMDGASWLSSQTTTGTATPLSPATITVTADPTNLPPQTYRGTVGILFADGTSLIVPVTMTISAASQAILLSQTGLSFTVVNGGGVIPARSFEVLNIGLGTVNWTATASTLSGGQAWLQINTTSGSSVAGGIPPSIGVSVTATGLAPGAYYGLVRVDAPGAANTPQVLTVFVNVLPAGSDPGATVDPPELVFTSIQGGPTPGSQSFLVYNVSATPKSYKSTATINGAPSIAILPSSATLDPNVPTRIVVQPPPIANAGVYLGSVDLQFNDGTVRSVTIRMIVVPPAGSSPAAAQRGKKVRADVPANQCSPSALLPSFTSLAASDPVTAGWPVPVVVSVKDDCGGNQISGSVTITFSNGDAPLALQPLLDGRWAGTWSSSTKGQATATLQAKASNPALSINGLSTLQLNLNQSQNPPVFSADGISSIAGTPPFTPLAPGSLITISGTQLAEVAQDAGTAPFPVSLGNTQVYIGGLQAPLLSVTPNQIQAVIPYGVTFNTTQQILINRGVTYSRPISMDFAAAQPAILANADGSGPQIFALRGSQPQPVTATNPALPGDTLLINCVGLGAVTPTPTDGSLPATAAVTSNPVSVAFGTNQVAADVAALTPDQVGVYQVTVEVPAGIPSGPLPLAVTVSSQTSAPVTLPVQGQ